MQNTNGTSLVSPQVVGTIYSPGSLRRALQLEPGAVDLLELRVDHFVADLAPLRAATAHLPAPLILTVRHPQEGGGGELDARQREALFQEFLPVAAFIDVEVRSLARLGAVLAAARAAERGIIISDHHFKKTPAARVLQERWELARLAGATVVKVAGQVETVADLSRLLDLFALRPPVPLSVMGMGPLGKVSRLLFAQLGSVLNYGYLDEPQVPGQWEATLLKRRLAEL